MGAFLKTAARLRRARLRRDEEGATLLEFAIVLPVFLTMLFGLFEFAFIIFISSSVDAAILNASRLGATGLKYEDETRSEMVLRIVQEQTWGLIKPTASDLDILIYDSFSDIGKPEPFDDDNGNGDYDEGESFTDINGNAQWDDDMGKAGLGGSDSIVLYRVRYAWGYVTPFIRNLLGDEFQYSSSVAVRNEPFN
ncbi:TadE/TadG family type IV pilus assembly protein [Amaricoccus tamworthensis]|uniref:TadE/TadG family type IV pilus assembly protein n=1 Tax=Amaricoccus tamworthensis TaxID=57002 RepID=UPI003C7E6916